MDEDDILYAFAIEPNHDKATLERYLTRYPDLAEKIIDLSLEIRLSASMPPNDGSDIPDPGAEAAWKELIAIVPRRPH